MKKKEQIVTEGLDEKNDFSYFDKFNEDLEQREKAKKEHAKRMQKDEDEHGKARRSIDRKYREHPLQRTRYGK